MSCVRNLSMQSDNNVTGSSECRVCSWASFALASMMIGLLAIGLVGCATYVPAEATVPLSHPIRLTGRQEAIEAAMRLAATHQELTVVGSPRVSDGQTTFMLKAVDGGVGSATLIPTQFEGVAAGECAVVVTANLQNDPSGVRAGRLVADFRDRWEELRSTGFAPRPRGWQ